MGYIVFIACGQHGLFVWASVSRNLAVIQLLYLGLMAGTNWHAYCYRTLVLTPVHMDRAGLFNDIIQLASGPYKE